jgi:hypothetical protein
MKLIIGIHGKLGSGKDWLASNIVIPVLEKLKLKFLTMSLADQIKINVMTKNNIKYCDVYKQKTQETRILLQNEGTNGRKIDENIWIKYLFNWIGVYNNRGIEVFVIPDLRYKNEYEFIKENDGIIIKVFAPERNKSRLLQESNGNFEVYNKIKTHQSEIDMDIFDDSKFDLIIDNDKIINIEDIKNNFEKLTIIKK